MEEILKKSIMLILISVIVVLAMGSCSTFNKTTNGALGYGKISGTEKGDFEAKGQVVYILHPSLISINNTNEKLDTIIDPALEAKGANAATNLVLDYVKVTGTAIKQ